MKPPPAARTVAGVSLVLVFSLAGPARAEECPPFDPRLLEAFVPRPIGPCNMGGRVVDVAVAPDRPATMYVATASGGLWKTVNNGTTWRPVFDQQETVALGDVAVAPSNPEVVWVGTGEANPRNSVSWGDGVYKSTDGGKSWQHMGLKDSAHIGRIVIHPRDPDVVYVAAMGHFWAPNKERGLFKTLDGGKNWLQVKAVNDETGFIDLVMAPDDPETLYAAAYPVRRDGFSGGNPAVMTGPGGGLFKTTDGGRNWEKMKKGLPDRPLGRCGLDVYARDPRVVYAVVQTDRTTATVSGQPARAGKRVETGGIFRSEDRGETWTKLNDLCPRPFYYGQIRVDPSDDQRVYVLGISMHVSGDGGKSFRNTGAPRVHSDHHALWIDPRDSNHLVLGCDGGVNFSYDRGATWEHVNHLPLGQFYAIGVDMRKPYRIYGGLQDNGSWGGPSANTSLDGITFADWQRILGADGFHCQADPTDPDTVYAESQYGRPRRLNVRTGASEDIQPKAPKGQPAYRFNWSAPLLLSPHNPHTVYFGGNHLFRSVDRGDHWEVVSPDLTRGKPGPSPHTGHTLTTIAESPRQAGVLYVGSDDGRVHVSRDGGTHWADVSDRLPGVPPDRWVTRLECSRFDDATAYLTFDRHRNDDRAPYVFRTTDYGQTWESLAGTLPPGGPVHVIREDVRNPDLLFVGTEFGLFVSLDRGKGWHRLRKGLPTVPVHDLVIHPRDRELVIATHGRSLYVLDVAPLEEMTPAVLASDVHLFDVKPATLFTLHGSRSWAGSRVFAGENPPYGATISYLLRGADVQPVRVTITDALGHTLATLKETKGPGVHQVQWDLRMSLGVGPVRLQPRVQPGDYVARLKVGDKVLQKIIRVEAAE